MNPPILKAFVLCSRFVESSGGSGQKDLFGAGLAAIRSSAPFPLKHDFSVYLEISDSKASGKIQLALMRADSGRRLFFWSKNVRHVNRLRNNVIAIRINQPIFPAAGVYFVEFWYDEKWQVDQRIEVM
jgi:hypothetical protein